MSPSSIAILVLAVISIGINAFPSQPSVVSCAGRIVGGYELDIADVPFQISLSAESVEHFCGGSIIGSRWVLTAAHCVGTDARYSVRVGSSRHGHGGRLVPVKHQLLHPEFNYTTVDYDFALLELAEELELGEKVNVVQLPDADEPVEEGACLLVSGWGTTQSTDESRDTLRAANVPAVDQELCSEAYSDFGVITDRMLCAGYEKGGMDACQGDSGGPLVDGNKLVGVVSWGRGCALEGYPGVYARVAAVREWIRENSGV